jgi:CHAT domain-containing protein
VPGRFIVRFALIWLLLLALPGIGSVSHRPARQSEPPALLRLRREGNKLLESGKYAAAVEVYQTGYERALKAGHRRSAVRFLNNLGSAYYKLYRFRDAIQTYLKARDLAASESEWETMVAICFNLSSIYMEMAEQEAAAESVRRGLAHLSFASEYYRAQLLIQSALLRARAADEDGAAQLLRQAIAVAQSKIDTATESLAWTKLGELELERKRLPEAEAALLEGYRLRKLARSDRISRSYEALAKCKLAHGDTAGATPLLDRAIETGLRSSPSEVWTSYYERGQAHVALGHREAALSDFENALKFVRLWRTQVVPADTFRVSSEVQLSDAYAAYIEAAARLYRQTRQQALLVSSFMAAEENRASSLRALWAAGNAGRDMPPEHRKAISELQRAEAAVLAGDSAQAAHAAALRLQLAEIEARAGLEDAAPGGGDSKARRELPRRMLSSDEAYFGFHLGREESWLWAIGRDGAELVALPPQREIGRQVAEFTRAVATNSADVRQLGERLYATLFGGISARLLDKSAWVIAPDGALFDLPFAALAERREGGTWAFAVERHAMRVVPGISALARSQSRAPAGPFVAVGDPIYNRADPRFHKLSAAKKLWLPGALHRAGFPLELARLAGSGREIRECAKVWKSHRLETAVLDGKTARKQQILDMLQSDPAVLHMAVHVLFPADRSGPGMIALSLEPRGAVELFGASEISALRAKVGLVVLNGCSSGTGEVLPGAGLMGLTRAWLAAGARGVIATRWAAADQDAGEIFADFYRRLNVQRGHSFARVLQEAQIARIRAGGRAAEPSGWAAYMCVERN